MEDTPILIRIDNSDLGNNQLLIEPSSLYVNNSITGVFNITLINTYGEEEQPADSLDICFTIPAGARRNKKTLENGCLAFFNETSNEWECEDFCIHYSEESNTLCGTTSHLTLFTVLLDLSSSSDREKCGDIEYNYITGSYEGDAILVAVTIIFICCLCLLLIPISAFFPSLHGSEYRRIYEMRKTMNNMNYTNARDGTQTAEHDELK